jgi:hypothetical protein
MNINDIVTINTQRARVRPCHCDEEEWQRALATDMFPEVAFSGEGYVVGQMHAFLAVLVPLEETLVTDLGGAGTLRVPVYVPIEDCRLADA